MRGTKFHLQRAAQQGDVWRHVLGPLDDMIWKHLLQMRLLSSESGPFCPGKRIQNHWIRLCSYQNMLFTANAQKNTTYA